MFFLYYLFFRGKADTDRLCRAASRAVTAADALGTVDVLSTLDLHRTDLFALVASHALFLVQIHLIEAEPGEQSVDGPEGTQVLAERSVYQRR